MFPEQFLAHPSIDFAVRGEGEATLAELVHSLEQGDAADLKTIAGLSGRDGEGFFHGPDREPIADLDRLPYSAIDTLINEERYRSVDFGSIMTSRGCPFGCTFCGVSTVWGRGIRYRSVEKVVEELELLKEEHGTSYFSFRDATFTLDRRRVVDLCHLLIERDPGVQWECLTRIDLVDEELLNLMVEAGCKTIRFGIESGCSRILQKMGKKVSPDMMKAGARLLHRFDLYWSAYILVGTPHETAESIRETMDFISEIDPPYVTLARFAPIPGTPIYEELEERGMIHRDIDWSMECNQRLSSHYVYNMSEAEFEDELATIAKFVEERNVRKSRQAGTADQRLK